MRIVQSFLANPTQTAADVATALRDVPPATLYRHLGVLVHGDVLKVVGQERRRGAVERTYALQRAANRVVGRADLARASRDDQLRYFGTFLSGLLGEFGRYLATNPRDPARDGVGYRSAVANLTDREMRSLLGKIEVLLSDARRNQRSKSRRPRLIARVSIPLAVPDA
jgi:hypothetical protein